MRNFLFKSLCILLILLSGNTFAQDVPTLRVAASNNSSFYLSNIQVSSVSLGNNNAVLDSSQVALNNTKTTLASPGSQNNINITSDTISHLSDSIQVTLTLKLNNLQKIDSIEIRYGSEKGDFILMSLKHINLNGKDYLKWYDYTYPIINNTVVLTGASTGAAYQVASLMVLNAKDRFGIKSNILPAK